MKVGPLLLEIHDAPKHIVTPHRDETFYFESVHTLCLILKDVPWLLAGGLAVPFTLGRFFREHNDIDVMVPFTSMPSACVQFRSAGYQLYKRVIASHNTRSVIIRYPVRNITKIKPNLNCSMLRIKGDGQYGILDKIDMHPFETKNGVLLSDYRGPILEVNAPLHSDPIETGLDTQFQCLALSYVARLKRVRHGVKHQIDLVAIEQGVDSAMTLMQQHYTP